MLGGVRKARGEDGKVVGWANFNDEDSPRKSLSLTHTKKEGSEVKSSTSTSLDNCVSNRPMDVERERECVCDLLQSSVFSSIQLIVQLYLSIHPSIHPSINQKTYSEKSYYFPRERERPTNLNRLQNPTQNL